MEELLFTKIPVVATLTAVFFLLTAAQTLHALFLAARKSGRPVSAATVYEALLVVHLYLATATMLSAYANHGTLLLHLRALLAEHTAQGTGVHAASHHLLGQEGHHDGSQDLEQLGRLVGTDAGCLAQACFGTRLCATEDVTENAAAVHLARGGGHGATTQQGAEQAAQIQAACGCRHVVTLQRAEQVFRALRRLGVAAQCTHDHGNRGGNGILCLGVVGAQLAGDLAQQRSLQLAQQLVDDGVVHGWHPS